MFVEKLSYSGITIPQNISQLFEQFGNETFKNTYLSLIHFEGIKNLSFIKIT